MAGETQTERIAALDRRVSVLEAGLAERSVRFDSNSADAKAKITELEREIRDLRQQLGAVNERCASLQRQSDRGWGLWQALLVLAISVAASAVTQLAMRR